MYLKKITAALPIFSVELTFISPDTVVSASILELVYGVFKISALPPALGYLSTYLLLVYRLYFGPRSCFLSTRVGLRGYS